MRWNHFRSFVECFSQYETKTFSGAVINISGIESWPERVWVLDSRRTRIWCYAFVCTKNRRRRSGGFRWQIEGRRSVNRNQWSIDERHDACKRNSNYQAVSHCKATSEKASGILNLLHFSISLTSCQFHALSFLILYASNNLNVCCPIQKYSKRLSVVDEFMFLCWLAFGHGRNRSGLVDSWPWMISFSFLV